MQQQAAPAQSGVSNFAAELARNLSMVLAQLDAATARIAELQAAIATTTAS